MHVSSARIAVSETFESSEGSKKRKTTSKPSPDRRLEVRERCFLSTQMTVCVLISFNVLQEYLRKRGFRFIYGVDEAGRGPLAGPVVAASCCLPDSIDLPGRHLVPFFPKSPWGSFFTISILAGLADSKKLSESQREKLFDLLTSTAGIHYTVTLVGCIMLSLVLLVQTFCMKAAVNCLQVEVVDETEIDQVNILQVQYSAARSVRCCGWLYPDDWMICLQATMLAMTRAIAKVRLDKTSPAPDFVLIDGNRVPNGLGCPAQSVVKVSV